MPHFANKYAVEEAIRAGGMPFTILRPAYFAQNELRLKPVLTGLGVYPVPVGNDGIAVVDVSEATVNVASTGSRRGQHVDGMMSAKNREMRQATRNGTYSTDGN